MLRRSLVVSSALFLFACSEEQDPALDVLSDDPEVAASAAALTAHHSIDIATDVGDLVSATFDLRTGVIPLQDTVVEVEHDVRTAAGRRVAGSLRVALSNACSPFGLEVEYHLTIESVPGSGDMLVVDGTVKLALLDAGIDLSVSLEKMAVIDGHEIRHSINVCLMLDLLSRHVAMNGHVLASVDNQNHRGVRIEDVRAVLCEPLPYHGAVIVEDPNHEIDVRFEETTPDSRKVTVNVDGNRSSVELDAGPVIRACNDWLGSPSLPATLDYATCGGCGQPPPKMPPPSTSSPNDL